MTSEEAWKLIQDITDDPSNDGQAHDEDIPLSADEQQIIDWILKQGK